MEQVQDNSQIHYVYVEKKDGCFARFLKLGCGIIVCYWIIALLIFFFKLYSTNTSAESEPIQYFQVTNGKKEVTIHTGMSKDSVIILLGQPTQFDKTKYWDEITYKYGEMGLSSLTIKFEEGKVSSVQKDDNEYVYKSFKSLQTK